MSSGLPFADPQFWIVTSVVVVVAALFVRRWLRGGGADAAGVCGHCDCGETSPAARRQQRGRG